jgi:hypothetical protein
MTNALLVTAAASVKTVTLFDKLGGKAGVNAAVDKFYEKVRHSSWCAGAGMLSMAQAACSTSFGEGECGISCGIAHTSTSWPGSSPKRLVFM